MKKHFLILTVFLVTLSSITFSGCYPIRFGQPVTDWYKGLSISNMEAYYFVQGNPLSLVGACHPKSQYIFSWEDGFYIWGVYAGAKKYQCSWVRCPNPQKDPYQRMVFFAAENTETGTKFIIDSALWDRVFNFFNFDASIGTVHNAGTLQPPKIKDANLVLRGMSKVVLEIPIPRTGYYSDPAIEPGSLIAGIAVLVKFSNLAPRDLHTSEFEVLDRIPVKIERDKELGIYNLEVEVSFHPATSGDAYFAYTLILEDGTSLGLENKPVLPFASPAVSYKPGLLTSALLTMPSGFDNDGLISPAASSQAINSIRAFKNGNEIDLNFKIQDKFANASVLVFRSFDLENWDLVNFLENNSQGEYQITEFLNIEAGTEVFYEIVLLDKEKGEEIARVRTMPRDN